MVEKDMSSKEEQFEQDLLRAICNKLLLLGEIKNEAEFLESYPKDNLADVHDNEKGSYYLMNRESPIKLVDYNLLTHTVTIV